MTPGERIKELRKSRHMTQQQLADKAHVTSNAVCMWERGRSTISRESLEMLCDIFNVEMDFLLGRQSVTMRYLNAEELDVIDAYRSLDYNQQRMVCQMLGVKRDESLPFR